MSLTLVVMSLPGDLLENGDKLRVGESGCGEDSDEVFRRLLLFTFVLISVRGGLFACIVLYLYGLCVLVVEEE